MYYETDIVDQVRSSVDIVDLVSGYVTLKRSGARFKGLCPFHNEKTPSFTVNPTTQLYGCFGCHESGNVFHFIEKMENLSFPEAVEFLAEKAGITLPKREYDPKTSERMNLKETISKINLDAAYYYVYMLRSDEGKHAREYLTGRGLSEKIITGFGLGYAGRYSDGLYKYLKSKGFSDDNLLKSGMFSFSERGVQDKFWNRVIFPIMDPRGRVVAFGGRIMGSAENAPKYLNSPETDLFVKSEHLYGIHLAKKTREKFFLLCEGYMDVISLHQAGFDNAVASLGTALTERQARKIFTYKNEVVITYDMDGAGRKAALRAIPILRNAGLSVKVLDMTPYKDPDEFILNLGADEYRARIEKAENGFEFETRMLELEHNLENPDSKTQFDHKLAEAIAKYDDPFARKNHITAAAKKYHIDENDLEREVNSIGAALQARRNNEEERAAQKKTKEIDPEAAKAKATYILLSILAQNPKAFLGIKDIIKAEDFGNEIERKIFRIIASDYEKTGFSVGARIVGKFEDAEEQKKVADILMTSGDFEDASEETSEDERRKAFADYAFELKKAALAREIEDAMTHRENDRLKSLLEEEDGLEVLRKKLQSISLS